MPEDDLTPERFDVVIIGSGAGGGTMAHALAGTDARVLLIERGDWLPSEPGNSDPKVVWQDLRYRAKETWLNKYDREFQPFMHYVVGGNTKMWGAALLRLRAHDFGEVVHRDGVSPAWPIDYATLAPWYDEAERIYQVHGQAGEDPTEAPRPEYHFKPVPHEPLIEDLVEQMRARGYRPFHLPLGLIDPGEEGGCLLCSTCNSFPCQVRRKADADVACVSEAVAAENLTMWTGALVQRLITDAPGNRVTAVEVVRDGRTLRVEAGLVVLAAGAVNSAAILLRSATERHPRGLANSSDLVGRNYMAHLATMMEAFHPFKVNPTVFQKTVALNDFYAAGEKYPYPLGHIQSQGRAHGAIVKAANRLAPERLANAFVARGVDWLAMSEDLPDPENRVTVAPSGKIKLTYRANNRSAHVQLVGEMVKLLKSLGYWQVMRHEFKNENTTHQCGTMVFGDDPATSVLDSWCRTHDVENLYVVDASFFASSAAVNPGLTVVAQSLRVADHLVRTRLNHGGPT